MKFSTAALVLATLAVESASAGTIRHAHQHVHQKKDAQKVEEAKRAVWTPPPGYDWHTDPGNSWDQKTTPTTAAPVVVATSAAPVAPSSSAKSSSTSESTSESTSSSSGSNTGISKFTLASSVITNAQGVKVLAGTNPTTKSASNGFVWVSDSDVGQYTNTLINQSGDDITVVVIQKSAALGQSQWVDQYAPAVTVSLSKNGGKAALQMDDGTSGSFAVVYPDTGLTQVGLLHSTLGEWTTAGADTTFDVSKIWTNSGHGMTIETGNGCKSSTVNDECAFKCSTYTYGDSCGDAGTYVFVKSASEWCNEGSRVINGVTVPEGGCKTNGPSNKITTTFLA